MKTYDVLLRGVPVGTALGFAEAAALCKANPGAAIKPAQATVAIPVQVEVPAPTVPVGDVPPWKSEAPFEP